MDMLIQLPKWTASISGMVAGFLLLSLVGVAVFGINLFGVYRCLVRKRAV